MEHPNLDVIKSVELNQETVIPGWQYKDYLHPVLCQKGIFVRHVGLLVYEYICTVLHVPIAVLYTCHSGSCLRKFVGCQPGYQSNLQTCTGISL